MIIRYVEKQLKKASMSLRAGSRFHRNYQYKKHKAAVKRKHYASTCLDTVNLPNLFLQQAQGVGYGNPFSALPAFFYLGGGEGRRGD